VVWQIEIDFQVNPLTLGRNLTLFVVPDILKVATNEKLRNIPVP